MPASSRRIMAAMPCNRKTLAAFFLFGVTGVLSAQQPSLPVDTILARLRANITDYRTSVPNFSCDEFVDSVRLDDGKIQDETKVQSSFRITRTTGGNLQETRIKNTVDGKPTKSQKVSLPFTFNGGFADMLQFLRSDCFEYRLGDPIPTDTSQVVLLFSMKPTFVGSPRCGLNKSERGTVVIDPDSFHVAQFTYQVEDIGLACENPLRRGPLQTQHLDRHRRVRPRISRRQSLLAAKTSGFKFNRQNQADRISLSSQLLQLPPLHFLSDNRCSEPHIRACIALLR
jgi:hypothetical protein